MTRSGFEAAVAVIAANRWNGIRMADRQLADALADEMPVLYVDPPSSVVTRWRDSRGDDRGSDSGVTLLREHLALLSPAALPGLTRPGVVTANSWLIARQIRRAVRGLGGTLRAVIDARVLSPVLGHCGEQLSVYWAQDDFVGLAPLHGESADRLRRAELRMTARADLIIAANPEVQQTVQRDGKHAELIPFGCDYQHFVGAPGTPPADDIPFTGPYAVFMGQVGDRIDAAMLAAVVQSGVQLLVVGPRFGHSVGSLYEQILDRPNVAWVGERGFDQLPAYLAGASVGVMPYNHSRFNLGSFPLKLLEYLAAGLPVVASDLPAVRWLDCDDIRVADDPTSFVSEVETALQRGRDTESDRRRQAFAANHTWQHRATAFAELIRSNRH